jgi:hypothetical protein
MFGEPFKSNYFFTITDDTYRIEDVIQHPE